MKQTVREHLAIEAGRWLDRLSLYNPLTWPKRMIEEVDAGVTPETVMGRCFAQPEKYADPVVVKFMPTEEKKFHAVTKLAPSTVDGDLRQFEGWATKPELDRTDEIVETRGVRFHNPTVLLLHHDHRLPVGEVHFFPKAEGIWFRAKMPRIDEPGELRDRVEGAFAQVKARLLTSVSIGFRALETKLQPDGTLIYTKSELYELSLVAVPALASARIDPTTIKALSPAKEKYFARKDAMAQKLGKKAMAPVSTLYFFMLKDDLDRQRKQIEDRLTALEQRPF